MADALISEILMVDRDVTSAADRGIKPLTGRTVLRLGRTRPVARGPERQNLHEVLTQAFLHALEQKTVKKIAFSKTSPDQLVKLAGMFAELASGDFVALRLKPDLPEGQRDAVRAFLEKVIRVSETLEENRLEAAIGKLAEVILPDELADARGALASDNLELRDRFITEVPQLTSVEVGAQAGLTVKNRYATAARWKKTGDIFSIQHRGTEYFPAFQFREGRPHPTIKKVLIALPDHLSMWQRALWFVSTNGWLGDKAPTDVLDDAEAVVAAAQHEGQEVVG